MIRHDQKTTGKVSGSSRVGTTYLALVLEL